MKAKFFSKFLVGAIVWSLVFLSLGLYSAEKAYQADPEIVTKLGHVYGLTFVDDKGHHLFHSSAFEATQEDTTDSWTFPATQKQIHIQTVNADVSIKTISGTEVQIKAEGRLNKKLAPRLLQIESADQELHLRQPTDDATSDLHVQIGLPSVFQNSVTVKSVSGDIGLEQVQVTDLDLKTVSGDISLKQVQAKTLKTKTVSGSIFDKDSSIKELSGTTVSGNIEVGQLIAGDLDLHAISGNVTLQLAQAGDSQFNLRSVSGTVHNRHPNEDQGHHHIDIKTTNGNIEIR